MISNCNLGPIVSSRLDIKVINSFNRHGPLIVDIRTAHRATVDLIGRPYLCSWWPLPLAMPTAKGEEDPVSCVGGYKLSMSDVLVTSF